MRCQIARSYNVQLAITVISPIRNYRNARPSSTPTARPVTKLVWTIKKAQPNVAAAISRRKEKPSKVANPALLMGRYPGPSILSGGCISHPGVVTAFFCHPPKQTCLRPSHTRNDKDPVLTNLQSTWLTGNWTSWVFRIMNNDSEKVASLWHAFNIDKREVRNGEKPGANRWRACPHGNPC